MANKTSDAQLRASQAWAERNKEKRRIISLRGSAKSFIRRYADEKDLQELEALIAERRQELEKAGE